MPPKSKPSKEVLYRPEQVNPNSNPGTSNQFQRLVGLDRLLPSNGVFSNNDVFPKILYVPYIVTPPANLTSQNIVAPNLGSFTISSSLSPILYMPYSIMPNNVNPQNNVTSPNIGPSANNASPTKNVTPQNNVTSPNIGPSANNASPTKNVTPQNVVTLPNIGPSANNASPINNATPPRNDAATQNDTGIQPSGVEPEIDFYSVFNEDGSGIGSQTVSDNFSQGL